MKTFSFNFAAIATLTIALAAGLAACGDDDSGGNGNGNGGDVEKDGTYNPNGEITRIDVADICPDANHPHVIDLGFGTKWACCNLGASRPEQGGDYFAWGETEPRTVDDYAYKYGNLTECQYIGDDISGTQYDAAKAQWGAQWCMPSLAEYRLLLRKCTFAAALMEGEMGLLATGTNGKKIFLPMAGTLPFTYPGEGWYWTSTVNNHENSTRAYVLAFDAMETDWHVGAYRVNGLTIRAISK